MSLKHCYNNSVPPCHQSIIPDGVVEVECLLLAKVYYGVDGAVSVAFLLCILDGSAMEESPLVPRVDIYRKIG